MPYKVNPKTGLIDYDGLEASANLFKPKMIVAGVSCYSRALDYARFKAIADQQVFTFQGCSICQIPLDVIDILQIS